MAKGLGDGMLASEWVEAGNKLPRETLSKQEVLYREPSQAEIVAATEEYDKLMKEQGESYDKLALLAEAVEYDAIQGDQIAAQIGKRDARMNELYTIIPKH